MSDSVYGAPAAKKTIELAAPKREFSLGGSIPIGVRYTNRSSTIMNLRDPRKTWEVKLKVNAQEVSFGKILRYAGEGRVRWSIEDAEELKLAPGAQHSFQYDAGQRWPERFVPGANTLQINDVFDDSGAVLSNPILVTVKVTTETVPALIDILASPEAAPESKAFAEDWLRRILPGYTTPEAARTWWAQYGDSPAMQSVITKINEDAQKR